LVAATSDRADQVAVCPEGTAQRRNLRLKAVLLDNPVGPHTIHQGVFADDGP
jgi:hypothetical protein